MKLNFLYQRIWNLAGAVSVRTKILGIILGLVALQGTGVTIQARYALTATMTTQLEEQSVSVLCGLAARPTDAILFNDLLGLHDLLAETLANNANLRYAFLKNWLWSERACPLIVNSFVYCEPFPISICNSC